MVKLKQDEIQLRPSVIVLCGHGGSKYDSGYLETKVK